MRAKIISAGIVLALMLAVCRYAMTTVRQDSELLRNLAGRSIAACEAGDPKLATALLDELLITIDERRLKLEVLTLHSDINDAVLLATEARVQLKYDQQEEFVCTMALLMETLTILEERQKLTIGNLF